MNTRDGFLAILLLAILTNYGCNPVRTNAPGSVDSQQNWQQEITQAMPMMGHRNWLLITDRAFPKQQAPGFHYISADQELLPVLQEVLQRLHSARHIRPVIFLDRELGYLTEQLVPGITSFRDSMKTALQAYPVQTILHDSVFTKMAVASRLFDIWVLKTTELKPYTSVFIELNCGYWSDENEKALRDIMRHAH
ncbi:MAG TPA: hypothetical protein VG842_08285 [Sediminibacterium sp.]|nr:hypothetical protein [Sediminibacterium sp.]